MEETDWKLDWEVTKRPVVVRFVEETLVEDAVPKTAVFVTCRATLDPWRARVVPVALVKVTLEEETVVTTRVLGMEKTSWPVELLTAI